MRRSDRPEHDPCPSTGDQRPDRRARVRAPRRLLAGLALLVLVAAACGGGSSDSQTGGGGDAAETEFDRVAAFFELVEELSGGSMQFDVGLTLTPPESVQAQGVPSSISVAGTGWVDLAAPAWQVELDLGPFLEAGGQTVGVDTTVTAAWENDTLALHGAVFESLTQGEADAVEFATADDYVLDDELAQAGLGQLALPLTANTIAALQSLEAFLTAEKTAGDDAATEGGGSLALSDVYPATLNGRLDPDQARRTAHDAHVAQLGFDPEGTADDFTVEIGYRFEPGGKLGEIVQAIDLGAAAEAAGFEDAESQEGSQNEIALRNLRAAEYPQATSTWSAIPLEEFKATYSADF